MSADFDLPPPTTISWFHSTAGTSWQLFWCCLAVWLHVFKDACEMTATMFMTKYSWCNLNHLRMLSKTTLWSMIQGWHWNLVVTQLFWRFVMWCFILLLSSHVIPCVVFTICMLLLLFTDLYSHSVLHFYISLFFTSVTQTFFWTVYSCGFIFSAY
jgi:hypothetical protein